MAIKKTAAKRLLLDNDWDGLLNWWTEERSSQRIVMSLMFDSDPLIRWRTIQALGLICEKQYKDDPEWVRGIIRQLLWGMNDESGNIIWNAPEALSEILLRIPELIVEYAPIVASNIELEPFPVGVHLFIARISSIDRVVFSDFAEYLSGSLNNDDPRIALFAGLALLNIDDRLYRQEVSGLSSDERKVNIYNFVTNSIEIVTVKHLLSDTAGKRASQYLRA